MQIPSLTATPLLGRLLDDSELGVWFAADSEVAAMLLFEAELAAAQAEEGLIPREAVEAIRRVATTSFSPDMEAIMDGAARDGVVVPEFLRQLRRAVGEPHAKHIHVGATSQDVIDTALIIRLKEIFDLVEMRLRDLIARLDALSARDGATMLMGRTRMQRARPITAARKIAAWRAPLSRHRERLEQLRPRLLVVQLGGAVGNRAELGDKAQAVADRLADALGLFRTDAAWHGERDGIVELGQWLALVAGSLGKIGADVALMAQNEIGEAALARGGGSSAMPEKNNPVKAEILVTLGRYAATLSGGLAQALPHENERSGAAWTLEWMLLPPLVAATGAALRNALALIEDVSFAPGTGR